MCRMAEGNTPSPSTDIRGTALWPYPMEGLATPEILIILIRQDTLLSMLERQEETMATILSLVGGSEIVTPEQAKETMRAVCEEKAKQGT